MEWWCVCTAPLLRRGLSRFLGWGARFWGYLQSTPNKGWPPRRMHFSDNRFEIYGTSRIPRVWKRKNMDKCQVHSRRWYWVWAQFMPRPHRRRRRSSNRVDNWRTDFSRVVLLLFSDAIHEPVKTNVFSDITTQSFSWNLSDAVFFDQFLRRCRRDLLSRFQGTWKMGAGSWH